MFAVGKKVKAGLYSKHATPTDLDNNGDLKMATDFRRVYATIIQEWVGYSTPKEILKPDYARRHLRVNSARNLSLCPLWLCGRVRLQAATQP